MTGWGCACVNQNCWFLNSSASSDIDPAAPAGAVTPTLKVTLPEGATSLGRAKTWLVDQKLILLEPPVWVVKCMSSSTGLAPLWTQVWLPVLFRVTETLWVWPWTQVGGGVKEYVADQIVLTEAATEFQVGNQNCWFLKSWASRK